MGHSGSEVGSNAILLEDNINREATQIANAWFKKVGLTVVTDNDKLTLMQRINLANKENLVGLIEWHANVGGGSGIEIYYSRFQTSAKNVANKMCQSVSHLLNNRGAKSSATTRFGGLGIVDDTTVSNAMLVELIFIDNKNDVNVWNKHKKEIVETICKAYCEQLGITLKDNVETKPENKPTTPKPSKPTSVKPREWSEKGMFTITKAPKGLALRLGRNENAQLVAWLKNGDVVKYDKAYADVNGYVWIRQTPKRKIGGVFKDCWIATGRTNGKAERIDYWGTFK